MYSEYQILARHGAAPHDDDHHRDASLVDQRQLPEGQIWPTSRANQACDELLLVFARTKFGILAGCHLPSCVCVCVGSGTRGVLKRTERNGWLVRVGHTKICQY